MSLFAKRVTPKFSGLLSVHWFTQFTPFSDTPKSFRAFYELATVTTTRILYGSTMINTASSTLEEGAEVTRAYWVGRGSMTRGGDSRWLGL